MSAALGLPSEQLLGHGRLAHPTAPAAKRRTLPSTRSGQVPQLHRHALTHASVLQPNAQPNSPTRHTLHTEPLLPAPSFAHGSVSPPPSFLSPLLVSSPSLISSRPPSLLLIPRPRQTCSRVDLCPCRFPHPHDRSTPTLPLPNVAFLERQSPTRLPTQPTSLIPSHRPHTSKRIPTPTMFANLASVLPYLALAGLALEATPVSVWPASVMACPLTCAGRLPDS